MLPKNFRLPAHLIPAVLKNGERYYGKLFTLIVAKQSSVEKRQGSDSAFAFIVSKKLDKRAVGRNRVKRLLREAIKNRLRKIKSGYNFIFWAKKELMAKNLAQIMVEIDQSLTKAKLYQTNEKVCS